MSGEYGPYLIQKRIAVGGMAEIYLAKQRGVGGVGRLVVLKRILQERNNDQEFITMFLDEARLMANLSHPNIAQVFDFGSLDGSHYLVMEYVPGTTLGGLLQAASRRGQGGLPEKEALGIALGMSEALAYLHGRKDELGRPLNIVHRDLNPANVMVSYDGAVKLIDFGIAKASTKVYETRTGVIKGTYGYIAPEQFTGASLVDHRADVFALGVLLYEMCIGKHPFDAGDESLVIERIVSANYKRPRQISPSFPRTLDRIITECLAPHPEGRPENVTTLIRRMTEHLLSRGLYPTMADLGHLVQDLVPGTENTHSIETLSLPQDTVTRLKHNKISANPLRRDSSGGFEYEPTIARQDMDLDQDDPSTVQHTLPNAMHVAGASSAERALNERMRIRKKKRSTTSWLLGFFLLISLGAGYGWYANLLAFDSNLLNNTPSRKSMKTIPSDKILLRIASDPDGAQVYVDNQLLPSATPAELFVTRKTPRVWVRVTKEGYLPEEREVSSNVGLARFKLVVSPNADNPQP